jgi:hypothetical protein
MPSLEKIVRPFQVGDVFRARRLPPNQLPFEIPTDEPITWEGRADGTFRELDTGLQVDFKATWEEDLSKRKSQLMKVVNPDDHDQKVFVERIDECTFNDKLTGREQCYKFDWSKSLDNATNA